MNDGQNPEISLIFVTSRKQNVYRRSGMGRDIANQKS